MSEVMPFIDLDGQQAELAKVREMAPAGDHERTHVAEKCLWQYTLVAIGSGLLTGEDAATAARVALETQDLKFERWFA